MKKARNPILNAMLIMFFFGFGLIVIGTIVLIWGGMVGIKIVFTGLVFVVTFGGILSLCDKDWR